MNAMTPPKLMPPFQRTAASGTLPIEQTKDTIATMGPTIGPHSAAKPGWSAKKKFCQNVSGTHAAMAPAINRPRTRSRRIANHSMTNTCETEVKPSVEKSRRQNDPSPLMDMSMAAWPSIEPASPRSDCSRAASMRRERTKSRNRTASTTIISGPPTNSAAVNCQPISRARMMPNSTTRLVEPISNAMAAVKLAPLRNSDRARATAAYEHDDDAAPSPAATARVRGRSSPIKLTIVERRTTAWTTADRAKPRISAHMISHVIDPANAKACPTAASTLPVTRSSASVACLGDYYSVVRAVLVNTVYPTGVYGQHFGTPV